MILAVSATGNERGDYGDGCGSCDLIRDNAERPTIRVDGNDCHGDGHNCFGNGYRSGATAEAVKVAIGFAATETQGPTASTTMMAATAIVAAAEEITLTRYPAETSGTPAAVSLPALYATTDS